MNTIVKVSYQENPKNLKITCNGKIFDTSNINEMKIEDLAYPFLVKGVKWQGLYEELKAFTVENEYTIYFDGDNKSFETLKTALQNFPVKLASTNNKVIILYSEKPFTTKITINGAIFDTSRIQNRSIDEWVKPIQIRDVNWKGIYQELSDYIGIDVYSIEFVGSQEFMNVLIEDCPETVSVVFRTPVNNANNFNSNIGSKINMQNISNVSGNVVNQMKQNVSDEEIEKNLQSIPIKNEFIRKNIMAICAIISLILTALPFLKVTIEDAYDYYEESVNGFTALFETDTWFSTVLFIGPILIIIMNYVNKLKPYRRLIAVLVPSISIIFEIVLTSLLKPGIVELIEEEYNFSIYDGILTTATTQIGFWLILLSYILTGVVGFLTYYGLDKIQKKK